LTAAKGERGLNILGPVSIPDLQNAGISAAGLSPANKTKMDKKTFENFKTLIFEKTGIHLTEQKVALVSARMGKRMRALGIPDYDQYYKYLTNEKSGHEMVEMVNAISTNVTHFFREGRHFDFMAETLRNWSKNGLGRLRIWCAASSSGEEPYSLAITATKNTPPGTKIEIVASDISTKVLQIAKFGVYKRQDVEKIPHETMKQYFQKGTGKAQDLFRVKQELRDLISFRQINLSTPPYPVEAPLDFIFCRNVMIYFNQDLRRILVKTMVDMLKPGGYLVVGMAESLSGIHENLKSVEPSVYFKSSS